MKDQLRPALTMLFILTVLTGAGLSAGGHRTGPAVFPRPGERQLDLARRQADRVQVDRTVFRQTGVFLESSVGDRRRFPTMPAASGGSNLGPTNPALIEAVKARVAALRAADPGNDALCPCRSSDCIRKRARPSHQPGGCPVPNQKSSSCSRDR